MKLVFIRRMKSYIRKGLDKRSISNRNDASATEVLAMNISPLYWRNRPSKSTRNAIKATLKHHDLSGRSATGLLIKVKSCSHSIVADLDYVRLNLQEGYYIGLCFLQVTTQLITLFNFPTKPCNYSVLYMVKTKLLYYISSHRLPNQHPSEVCTGSILEPDTPRVVIVRC